MASSSSSTSTMNKIERAHQMYRESRYSEALGFYTEALSLAKTKSQKIALHSNRAACFLKLHEFKKAADECTLVLELDHKHTGALMLRAQTLVTLKEYRSALFDVNRLIELNPSSQVYQNLHSRLKTQVSLAPIPEVEVELEKEDEEEEEEEEEAKQCTSSKQVNEGDIGLGKDVTEATEVGGTETIENSSSWETIPQPKGHSRLDYSRWDRVEDESSEDDDDDEEEDDSQPQYRFRVRNIGVRPVK